MNHTIAIQGFEGSFHQIAAQHYFGPALTLAPCATFTEVVRQVTCGEAHRGVMAIENSIAGSILPNYNLLQQNELQISGEVYLTIGQHLMALPGQSLADIREVHSHPMALLQCADFLSQYPHLRLVETEDTALSAKRIRDNQLAGVAAVAGRLAADLFEMDILAADIQSAKENYTRFLVVERPEDAQSPASPNKASLYFHTVNTPGSLVKVLSCIADHNINLSKLQSIPHPGRIWEYFILADLEFDRPEQFQAALHAVEQVAEGLRVLGVYQKGITY
ncbi:prephenate dehydratase [Hymenobacter jejuensis]|uniref:prephenate dehydratase n=1 Tax=Hymenobacter jejuensis TaxID=2502781 RepID=A0A5B8A1S4_9BACT|nr:prephenate dehydratase [Hymenobacter jejuensis]QDA60112.1 chorismate mutase [Hymenobacter jejuensis]